MLLENQNNYTSSLLVRLELTSTYIFVYNYNCRCCIYVYKFEITILIENINQDPIRFFLRKKKISPTSDPIPYVKIILIQNSKLHKA